MTESASEAPDSNPQTRRTSLLIRLGTAAEAERAQRALWRANLYAEVLEDIKIELLQGDMQLKYLQLQLKKFLDR